MEGRIPLSIVFDAGSRRDCVPHRTFTKPLSDSAFFKYLNSNDTRLPRHRLLDLTPLPAEEYDTLTGEDDWLGPNVITSTMSPSNDDDNNVGSIKNNGKHDNNEECTRSDNDKAFTHIDNSSRVRFDEVVQWVAETLEMSWACGDDNNDNTSKDFMTIAEKATTEKNDCHSISNTLNKNDNGVVLCGKYVVADDCPWAVSSRSVQLYTVREVFMAMRNSCKFLRDIEYQLMSAQRQSERGLQTHKWQEETQNVHEICSDAGLINCHMTCNVQSEYKLEFTLAKAVSCSSASEMRIFIPHYLQCSLKNNNMNSSNTNIDGSNNTESKEVEGQTCEHIMNKYTSYNKMNGEDDACTMKFVEPNLEINTEALWDYVGVSQRATDVCFPCLMQWDTATHHENYTSLVNRIRHYNLVERAHKYNPYFLQHLLTKSHEMFATSALESNNTNQEKTKQSIWQHTTADDTKKITKICNCFAILAIDVVFERPSLPIYLLSAKVKVYKPKYDEECNDNIVPLLMEKHEEARNIAENNDLGEFHCTTTIDNSNNINDDDDDDNSDEESEFFRLFRDAEHWNYYVRELRERMQSTHRSCTLQHHECNDRSSGNVNNNSNYDSNAHGKNTHSTVVQNDKMRFCVVATEMNDLVRTRDSLTRRGLPLELCHPELLSELPEVMTFVKQMRDKMEQEYSRQ